MGAACERSSLAILVVDSDAASRQMVRGVLERLGVGVVREAANGIDGLRALTQNKVDGVFCDVQMTPMDGVQFVRMVRRGLLPPSLQGRAELPATVPVIMTSVDTRREMVEQAYRSGADGYLAKPLQPAQLEQGLERCRSKILTNTSVGLSYTRAARAHYVRYILAGQFVPRAKEPLRRMTADLERDQVTHGVIDLSGINFIDEFGIGLLLIACGTMRERGRKIALISGNPEVDLLIRRLRLPEVIDIYEDIISYHGSVVEWIGK